MSGRISDKLQQMTPRTKQHDPDRAAQLIPEFSAGAEFFAARLKKRVCQFEYLMDEKGQKYEEKKDVSSVFLAMPVVVFRMISKVFQRVEIFIFDFPSGSTAVNGRVK